MTIPVVTSHTPHRRYTEGAKRLARSCEEFSLPITIYEEPDRGSWQRNILAKGLIWQRSMKTQGLPFLWLDADAIVRATPPPPVPGVDLAWVYNNDSIGLDIREGRRKMPFHPRARIRAGTVFFLDTPGCRKYITDVATQCEAGLRASTQVWEQKIMWLALTTSRPIVQSLPLNYCYITNQGDFDRREHHSGYYDESLPLIIEHQARVGRYRRPAEDRKANAETPKT